MTGARRRPAVARPPAAARSGQRGASGAVTGKRRPAPVARGTVRVAVAGTYENPLRVEIAAETVGSWFAIHPLIAGKIWEGDPTALFFDADAWAVTHRGTGLLAATANSRAGAILRARLLDRIDLAAFGLSWDFSKVPAPGWWPAELARTLADARAGRVGKNASAKITG